MDKEYKYFDKIDIDYIKLKNGDCNNLEEYNRIDCAKKDKYKDCDLDNIYKIPFQSHILEEIYIRMCNILPFKDLIYMYKWKVQEYNHGKGITTNEQIKQFFREISMILDGGEVYILDGFNTYVNSLLSNNPTYLSNPNERLALQTSLSQVQLQELYNKLVEKKYIEASENTFLACFGHYAGGAGNEVIKWKKTAVEYEILLKNIVTKENNPKNFTLGLPRQKIEKWFVDKNKYVIKPQKKITNDEKGYPIYLLIQEFIDPILS